MARRITLELLRTEAAAGVILAGAALAAILLANSQGSDLYFGFIGHPLTLQIGAFNETLSVLDWVTQGLMTIFFFSAGMEIKFEILRGELSNPRRLALPVLVAVGGVVVPALVFLAFNARAGGAPQGWPVPAATDVAMALAALAIAGRHLPASLRTLLLTLAIASEIVAMALIGLLFTTQLDLAALAAAVGVLALMFLLGRWRNAPYFFYATCLALIWAFTLKSGVSTAMAGLMAAMTIPLEARRQGQVGVLAYFMESLRGYVAFLILPLFAFVASGVRLADLSAAEVFSPVTLGVALGLFLGKQVGVFGAIALALGLKLARRPTGARWIELYGIALLCGVGFTLSLYIGALAFPGADPTQSAEVRLGVLGGSVLSLLSGMAILGWSQALRRQEAA